MFLLCYMHGTVVYLCVLNFLCVFLRYNIFCYSIIYFLLKQYCVILEYEILRYYWGNNNYNYSNVLVKRKRNMVKKMLLFHNCCVLVMSTKPMLRMTMLGMKMLRMLRMRMLTMSAFFKKNKFLGIKSRNYYGERWYNLE